jgi:hypothetical protein
VLLHAVSKLCETLHGFAASSGEVSYRKRGGEAGWLSARSQRTPEILFPPIVKEVQFVFSKSPLQSTMEVLLDSKGVVWLTGSQPENRDKIAEILFRVRPAVGDHGTGDHISMVCGELAPMPYDDAKIVNALHWALTEGAQIQVIFQRGNSPEEAARLLQETNPRLFRLWQENQERFILYWSPIRMNQHFMAISDLGVLFERPETDKGKRDWWAIFMKDKALAEEWTNRFTEYTNTGHLRPLTFPQSSMAMSGSS